MLAAVYHSARNVLFKDMSAEDDKSHKTRNAMQSTKNKKEHLALMLRVGQDKTNGSK